MLLIWIILLQILSHCSAFDSVIITLLSLLADMLTASFLFSCNAAVDVLYIHPSSALACLLVKNLFMGKIKK